jgi:AraC-like DNA-binding protein
LSVTLALRPWVSDIAVLTQTPSVEVITRGPDGATTLVFRSRPDAEDEVLVLGPRTSASYHHHKDVPFAVRVRLRPGRGRAVLGVAIDQLTNETVPLRDLWGTQAQPLASALRDARNSPEHLVSGIEERLRSRLSSLTARDEAAARLAEAAAGELSGVSPPRSQLVADVARRLDISERHLRDVFTRAVGLSPKRFARIERVRHVLRAISQGDLALLAHDVGYYDQSHLTAEFRTIMGTTPRAFIAGLRPAPTGC